MKLTIHCDGGARGNPGPAASAFVVTDENNSLVHEQGFFLGETTNNVAEYTALIKAFEWLIQSPLNYESLTCIFDSELVVKQITGVYKIKSPHLATLAGAIRQLQIKLPVTPTYLHVRREQNKDADRLVNQTLDSYK